MKCNRVDIHRQIFFLVVNKNICLLPFQEPHRENSFPNLSQEWVSLSKELHDFNEHGEIPSDDHGEVPPLRSSLLDHDPTPRDTRGDSPNDEVFFDPTGNGNVRRAGKKHVSAAPVRSEADDNGLIAASGSGDGRASGAMRMPHRGVVSMVHQEPTQSSYARQVVTRFE